MGSSSIANARKVLPIMGPLRLQRLLRALPSCVQFGQGSGHGRQLSHLGAVFDVRGLDLHLPSAHIARAGLQSVGRPFARLDVASIHAIMKDLKALRCRAQEETDDLEHEFIAPHLAQTSEHEGVDIQRSHGHIRRERAAILRTCRSGSQVSIARPGADVARAFVPACRAGFSRGHAARARSPRSSFHQKKPCRAALWKW
jgi:hypothetical protein